MSETVDTGKPIVTRITGECERSGACQRCGERCRRMRLIHARSLEELDEKVALWELSPLLHARCEQMVLADEG